ncbi:MAG: hypothetical protein IPO08_23510 [Xanthomonadales bacterium]|nr:hypothetical protein [Xanthomonadales bacterium]
MAARRIITKPGDGLTPDTGSQVLTAQQRAELAFSQRGDEDEDEDEQIEQTSADRIEAMLIDHSDSARAVVKLYRIAGAEKKLVWCDDFAPADFEAGGLGMIRERYGSGEYQIRLYATSAHDKLFCIRARENISIEAVRGLQQATQFQPQQNNELAQVVQLLAQGQQQILAALSDRQPAPDPMAQMTQMLTMMKLMKDATASEPPKERTSLGEIVEAMRMMRDVSEEFNPNKKEEASDPLMAMLPQALSLIGQGMQNQQAQQIQQPPVQHHQQPQETENEEMNMQTLAEIKKEISSLVEKAVAGVEPERAALPVYEELPDEGIEILKSDEWFDVLKMVCPEVAPHGEWFGKVRAKVLALLAEDDAGVVTVEN